jgi:hypothetical protein
VILLHVRAGATVTVTVEPEPEVEAPPEPRIFKLLAAGTATPEFVVNVKGTEGGNTLEEMFNSPA